MIVEIIDPESISNLTSEDKGDYFIVHNFRVNENTKFISNGIEISYKEVVSKKYEYRVKKPVKYHDHEEFKASKAELTTFAMFLLGSLACILIAK